MSVLRNRLITRAVTTFGLNSEDEYRKASAFVDHAIAEVARTSEGGTPQEHVQAIRDYLEKMSTTDTWGWDDASEDLDAVEAALAKLRDYAQAVELKWWNEVDRRANGHLDTVNLIENFRAEKSVTDLMGDES